VLKIGDRLETYTIGAGEPWIQSVQMRTMSGSAVIDWSSRKLALSFYGPGRTLVTQIEGVYTSDATGAYFAFVRDGRFSEKLFGQAVSVELAERLLDGKDIIATGGLSVVTSSEGVASFGVTIGRIDCRFTLYFNAIGIISLVEQDLLPYGGVPVTPGPVITTRASIASDGTPQLGETLTGIDPVGNGSVVARRWMIGTATVSIQSTYVPTAVGSLRFEADLQGPDGTIATSTSTIAVQSGPTLGNTPLDSTILITSLAGASAAFDTLQSTADDQDGRLAQLEAA